MKNPTTELEKEMTDFKTCLDAFHDQVEARKQWWLVGRYLEHRQYLKGLDGKPGTLIAYSRALERLTRDCRDEPTRISYRRWSKEVLEKAAGWI